MSFVQTLKTVDFPAKTVMKCFFCVPVEWMDVVLEQFPYYVKVHSEGMTASVPPPPPNIRENEVHTTLLNVL